MSQWEDDAPDFADEIASMRHCRECGTLTNHTTAQHLTALEEQGPKCYECGDVAVKEDGDTCGECLSELAEMYHPEEGGDS